mmetsp:Transcript_4591/g.7959  ORF Transcript_4591/g.7959 Transcript_4591/m.7959 type:complete len:204 (+) Transcript_4591:60-671(+)
MLSMGVQSALSEALLRQQNERASSGPGVPLQPRPVKLLSRIIDDKHDQNHLSCCSVDFRVEVEPCKKDETSVNIRLAEIDAVCSGHDMACSPHRAASIAEFLSHFNESEFEEFVDCSEFVQNVELCNASRARPELPISAQSLSDANFQNRERAQTTEPCPFEQVCNNERELPRSFSSNPFFSFSSCAGLGSLAYSNSYPIAIF